MTAHSGSPAVSDTGVYVSYNCQQDYRFSLRGHLIWHHSTACDGGGGSTAVLHGSSVYARGVSDPPIILATLSGDQTGSFASDTAPAFGSRDMDTLQGGNLVAVDPSGRPNRWEFSYRTLVAAPVVSGGVVFAGSSDGTVYGISARSGAQVWAGTAGSMILGPGELSAGVKVGMAVGGGLLVIPAGNVLTAFGDRMCDPR